MMHVQHDASLSAYYLDTVERVRRFLEEKYLAENCPEEEITDLRDTLSSSIYADSLFLKVKVGVSNRTFTLVVAIPKTFPDRLPKIYLSTVDFKEMPLIPHVDKNRFVCTRDPDIVYVNDKLPEQAVDELLTIAVEEILGKGLRKQNTNDFMDEFLAYWNDQALYSALSLFYPTAEITGLKTFKLAANLFDGSYIISDSEEAVKNWLAPFNLTADTNNATDALYLPLAHFDPDPFFEGNRSVLSVLRNLGDKWCQKALEAYFNQDRNTYLIFSSLLVNGERLLFGWKHLDVSKIVKGFRKNHVPLAIRLNYTRDGQIEKIKVRRVDKERILKRGGSGPLMLSEEVSVALVGCGSVGSYLAMALVRCGLSKLLLVDNDTLEPENAARHLCGFVEASKSPAKVDAVKKRLKEHFPHIECETLREDFLNVLLEPREFTVLARYRFIVLATANLATERRTNHLVKQNVLRAPVFYIWLEPYGVAGHVLYVHPTGGGCYQCCFDEKAHFRYSVAAPDASLFVREHGLQSSFLPYAFLDIEQFASLATRFILQGIEGGLPQSTLFTWLGDLAAYERLGYKLNDIYVTDSSYTFAQKTIYPHEECSLCR